MKSLFIILIVSVTLFGQKPIQIITFDYPPFTMEQPPHGFIENHIRNLLNGNNISFAYYPVARALLLFELDSTAFFAGSIRQFPDSLQGKLTSFTTYSTMIYLIKRKGTPLKGGRLVGLRRDAYVFETAKKFEMKLEEIETVQQGLKMIELDRADAMFILKEELSKVDFSKCELVKSQEQPFNLELVYFKSNPVGNQVKKRLELQQSK